VSSSTPFAGLPRGTEAVLLVDDNDAVRGALGQILAQLGYRVSLARDAPAAILLASVEQIALVIVDVFLPGRRGTELVAELRATYPGVRAILISGADMQDPALEIDNIRDIGVLQKPITVRDLAWAVRDALDG
jgi:two-component system cell cycle sensor histidine kinase/response regulator CckA